MKELNIQLQPNISVVIALTDHRGWVSQSLKSWNAQNYPKEKIQLLIMHAGNDPTIDLDLEVRAHLKPHDKLICLTDESEVSLFDAGIRNSNTEWVFITEPHAEMDSYATEHMIEYLLDSRLDGACCSSGGSEKNNFVGRMEDAIFAEGFTNKSSPGH
jgi:hypothetical protein